jgi:hypothetical protein
MEPSPLYVEGRGKEGHIPDRGPEEERIFGEGERT